MACYWAFQVPVSKALLEALAWGASAFLLQASRSSDAAMQATGLQALKAQAALRSTLHTVARSYTKKDTKFVEVRCALCAAFLRQGGGWRGLLRRHAASAHCEELWGCL